MNYPVATLKWLSDGTPMISVTDALSALRWTECELYARVGEGCSAEAGSGTSAAPTLDREFQRWAFLLDEEAEKIERSMGMAFYDPPQLAGALRAGANALRRSRPNSDDAAPLANKGN